MGATRRICSSRQLEQEHSGIVSLVLGHLDMGDSLIGKARATLRIRGWKTCVEKNSIKPAKLQRMNDLDRHETELDAQAMSEAAESGEVAPAPDEPRRKPPREAVAEANVRAPTRGNRKLEALLEGVNADPQVGAWWYMDQLTSERLEMSDHSWVHVQVVLNVALRLLRLLVKGGVEPAMVADHSMRHRDAEVVVAAGALLHDVGLSIHRADHEAFSLFLASRKLDELLDGVYDEPERTVVVSEALHAIIGHRRSGEPFTVEAAIVRVADALDMARGRSRVPFESGRLNIHSLSAYAIEEVRLTPGSDKAVRVEIAMSNSAGIYQVDELLATKLRGSPIEDHVEVIARIDAEHEKRLIPVFRI